MGHNFAQGLSLPEPGTRQPYFHETGTTGDACFRGNRGQV